VCHASILEAIVDRRPALDQIDIDRRDLAACHEAQRGVARGCDEVETALVHQRDHFIGGRCCLDGNLAAGFLFE
jgi:hypothetical protein